MDSLRSMVKQMVMTENTLLKERTADLTKASEYTPIIIMLAALLAILITIIYFYKMNKHIDLRSKLQEELEEKDRSISKRISLIQDVSYKISGGDYSVRVEDKEEDSLGNISIALNKMAASLERSFNELADREWLQSGMAGLNDAVIGNDNLKLVTGKILSFIAGYTDSQVGALYINVNNEYLELENGYALTETVHTGRVKFGEGIVGQCAKDHKQIVLADISEKDILTSAASAQIKPVNIAVFPCCLKMK